MPDARGQLEPVLRDVLNRRDVVTDLETTLPDKDTGLPRTYATSLFPVRDSEQGVNGVGLIVSDITDRKRTDAALRASQQRFRAAVEAVGDIIWTTDASGQMHGEQPDWAAYTGQSEAQYRGSGWSEAIHPDDVDATLSAWRKAIAERRMFTDEHRLKRYDGQYRLFEVRAVPVLDENASVREWVGVHEDISDRKLAEEMLLEAKASAEEANRAKSQFIANMSHELRTPLSAIIGYCEMIEEEVEELNEAPELVQDLRKINDNAKHLLSLINDVLDISKIEAGKMEIYIEKFDLAELARGSAKRCGRSSRRRATCSSSSCRRGSARSSPTSPRSGRRCSTS